ncbi:hypothetical protein V1514DRAFT_282006, partial [Lipomyces japonicus]|uniref:uncharacterized protein n=1 Tax=Lipomyces japonicus TaxID=56871 RepID=UPI0034CE69B5
KSTFNGTIREFPDIRIDHFKFNDDRPPPKACFLSHMHSDHLDGLASSYGGPYIYCSAATKRIVLQLEKRTSRINKLTNITQHGQRQYRHLGPEGGCDVFKELPLNAPVKIQLDPKQQITVTLIDVRSTMFLIEGQGKTILYTGDILAEDWWLNSLSRSPLLLPYVYGFMTINTIYLDTTFCSQKLKYGKFPPKAVGSQLLLKGMARYPNDVVFHINAWTWGYEELLIALSAGMNSKIHVGKHRYNIFKSIRHPSVYEHGPALSGYSYAQSGNAESLPQYPDITGCLTMEETGVRLHACERAFRCEGRNKGQRVVYISPVVSSDLGEAGSPSNSNNCKFLQQFLLA